MIDCDARTEQKADNKQNILKLVDCCVSLCNQCINFLETVLPENFISGHDKKDSVGSHMRRIVDRINCVFKGIESGNINYDERDRDNEIEKNPYFCKDAFLNVIKNLNILSSIDTNGAITVSESINVNFLPIRVITSLDRELLELLNHTTHHMAVVRRIMNSLGEDIGDNFGRTPSSIIYENKHKKD